MLFLAASQIHIENQVCQQRTPGVAHQQQPHHTPHQRQQQLWSNPPPGSVSPKLAPTHRVGRSPGSSLGGWLQSNPESALCQPGGGSSRSVPQSSLYVQPPTTPPRARTYGTSTPVGTARSRENVPSGNITPMTAMSDVTQASSAGPGRRPGGRQGAEWVNGGRGEHKAGGAPERYMIPEECNAEHFRHPRANPATPHLTPPFGHDVNLEDIRLPPAPPDMSQTETNNHRLRQRQKQIEFGMATQGYVNFIAAKERGLLHGRDPKIPNIYQVCSKRSWDGQVRRWRQYLHQFDELTNQLWTPQQQDEIRKRAEDESLRRKAMQERGDFSYIGLDSVSNDHEEQSGDAETSVFSGSGQPVGCESASTQEQIE